MPKPKTKDAIIERMITERRRLENTLAGIPLERMETPGVVGEWSLKDVLAHLADWEAHMLTWVDAARRGEKMDSPGFGLNWRQWDDFNAHVYEIHRSQPLAAVLDDFHSVHTRFMEMVQNMPEDEMLTPGRYQFVGKSTIYNWLGAYANHDHWGAAEIRRWLKESEK